MTQCSAQLGPAFPHPYEQPVIGWHTAHQMYMPAPGKAAIWGRLPRAVSRSMQHMRCSVARRTHRAGEARLKAATAAALLLLRRLTRVCSLQNTAGAS